LQHRTDILMRSLFAIAVLVVSLNAQEIDRIAVVVNNQAITMGDWEQQERFEAMSNGEPWQGVKRSHDDLDRLIDRALILEQMQRAGIVRAGATATAAQFQTFRTQLKLENDDEWKATLKRYGLLEADVADIIAEQTAVLHFMEQKFRPSVHIAPEDVR